MGERIRVIVIGSSSDRSRLLLEALKHRSGVELIYDEMQTRIRNWPDEMLEEALLSRAHYPPLNVSSAEPLTFSPTDATYLPIFPLHQIFDELQDLTTYPDTCRPTNHVRGYRDKPGTMHYGPRPRAVRCATLPAMPAEVRPPVRRRLPGTEQRRRRRLRWTAKRRAAS